jgi:2-oxoisovalerate dehydrogenase E2 component (dihydrolipoyl transacylase)
MAVGAELVRIEVEGEGNVKAGAQAVPAPKAVPAAAGIPPDQKDDITRENVAAPAPPPAAREKAMASAAPR